MRLSLLLIITCTLSLSATTSYSQQAKLSLSLKNASLQDVLQEIGKKSDFSFWYSNNELNANCKITLAMKDQTIDKILDIALKDLNLAYEINDKIIVIYRQKDATPLQQQKVKGTITDATTGEPIIGANIVVEGTTIGVVTDSNGAYSIDVPATSGQLIISYIGYNTEKVQIAGQSILDIKLVPDITKLDEVVVIGYGTKKKRDVIGSVASISSEELTKSSSSSVLNALQGRAAGIQISQQSGLAGSEYTVKIRGIHSINSGNDPLWIIDGMPGNANDLNPNDIQSIDVLKDASATAIYGSRGSNGVVIVTTKMGKTDKGEIVFDYKTGVSDVLKTGKDYGYANTAQWFGVIDEARKNSGINTPWEPMDILQIDPDMLKPLTREQALQTENNWFDKYVRQGTFQDINLSTSRGSEKGSVFFSVNYRDQKGVVRHDDQKKYTGRINADFKPVKILNLGARLNLIYTSGNIGSYTKIYPWRPIYDPDDNEGTGYWNVHSNPVASIDPRYNLNQYETMRGIGGIYAELSIPFIKGLSVRTEGSFDFSERNSTGWQSAIIRSLQQPNNGSTANEGSDLYKGINYNIYAKYNRTFGQHTVSATFGTESTSSYNYTRNMWAKYLLGSYQELGHDPGFMGSMQGQLQNEDYLRSYFGRADYKFKDRYLLGISLRRDGSSRFTTDYRWGTFTAYSAGWIMSEENFMKGLDFVSMLKLRGSYGQTGNNQVAFYRTQSSFSNSFDYSYGIKTLLSAGSRISVMGNPSLTWETTTSYDFGLDYSLFRNKVSGSVAWYLQDVDGLVLAQPLPESAGLAGGNEMWANVGRILNKGIEFSISSVNIDARDFKWTTDFNITTNHNKVKNLTKDLDKFHKGIWQDHWYSRTGGPLRAYAQAEYAGVDPEKGVDMIWESDRALFDSTGIIKQTGRKIPATDENGGNNYSDTKKTPIPTFFGGLNNTFSYKGFDLSVMFTFSGGNYIYDSEKQGISRAGYGEYPAINAEVLTESWKKPGDIAKYSQLRWQDSYEWGWDPNAVNPNSPTKKGDWIFTEGGGNNYKVNRHTRYLYKGDYIRLKYVEIGYNLPQSICSKLYLKGLRIYVSGQNLLTFTKYPGWDPELGDAKLGNVGGETWGSGDYTMSRTFNFGASLKF